MNTNTSVRQWVDSLRGLALGVSMASLFLAPATGYPNTSTGSQRVQRKGNIITTIPDGTFDLRTMCFRTPSGLQAPALSSSFLSAKKQIARESIPHVLRDITGLPIETLASLAHVSRNAYYKWLDGKGVSDEHGDRLNELLDTFRTLCDLRGSDLKEFLETTGPVGRPIDLLIGGESSAVIGSALRPLPLPEISSSVSNTARQISGLPGWLRPTVRLNWGAPRLTSTERDEALNRLSPGPLLTQIESPGNIDEDDNAFVAWGIVLE